MTVTDEEHLSALGQFLLQKALNIRNDTSGFRPDVQRVALLEKTSEHVDH
jgi:hypothetical protein